MTYSCIDGQLFDISKAACSDGYVCPATAPALTTTVISLTSSPSAVMEPASSGAQTDVVATMDFPDAPTAHPTKLGANIYYGDFRTTSCQSINDLIQGQPDWVTEEVLFKSKEECCKEMFSWAPLENCLGPGFVESNYVIGSRSPTLSPTISPTNVPSLSPSGSLMPSYAPSGNHTDVPSSSPSLSGVPTSSLVIDSTEGAAAELNGITQNSITSSTTTDEPELTTTTHQNPANEFLVELLGWANADMVYPEGSTVDVYNLTPSPVEEEDQISELILPVLSDATISQNRPDANFGANTALAVDGGTQEVTGGDTLGERFDSLIKFDVGMIDSTRDIESAALRIYSLSDCLGGTFTTTVDSDWNQDEVIWDTAPSDDEGVLFGVLKEVRQNRWYEFDISSALEWHDNLDNSGGSFLSIRMTSTENSRCLFSSMENGGVNAPFVAIKYLAPPSVAYEIVDPRPKPAPGQFILLLADADSTLSASTPTTVLSNEDSLKVEFNPETRKIHDTLIRFDLSQIRGATPRSAILSLFSEIDCPSAGTITTTGGDPNWDETAITWISAPNYLPDDPLNDGVMIGTFGAVSSNRWYGFDVAQALKVSILAKKTKVTFRISSGNTETCKYSSKESGREPKLMVSF
ncbi:hypothetical protein ACHAXM_001677 [Skeletonema potamos]